MSRKRRNSGNKDVPDKKEAEVRQNKSNNAARPERSTRTDNSETVDKTSSSSDKSEESKDGKPFNKGGNARNATNDPEWYSKDNQLVMDAASLPYAEPLGDPLRLLDPSSTYYNYGSGGSGVFLNTGSVATTESIAGILTVRTKASFGTSKTVRSPLNVAANMLYTHTRYMNSGRKNYDPQDEMIYVGALADVYSFTTWMERIYAKAFVYSQRNKYIGDMLLQSEGIDPNNIRQNLANMRYWINSFINKISAFAIPTDITYFNRRAWIYSAIYLENPDGNIKDQLYQFTPDGFFKFTLNPNDNSGMLRYYRIEELKARPTNGYTLSDLIDIGNSLLANITNDEDFGLMSGDIIKAFDGRIIGVPPLPESVELIPVYSDYVLEQIHNLTVVNSVRGINNNPTMEMGNVTQDPTTGLLYSYEGIEISKASFDWDDCEREVGVRVAKILSCMSPMPNPIDNMEITRMSICQITDIFTSSGGNKYGCFDCGADYATQVTLTGVTKTGVVYTGVATNSSVLFSDHVVAGSPNSIKGMLNWFARLRCFKFAPILYIASNTGDISSSTTNIDNVAIFGNIDNYTIVTNVVLSKLHEVAMLSMLSVPGVAKLVNI